MPDPYNPRYGYPRYGRYSPESSPPGPYQSRSSRAMSMWMEDFRRRESLLVMIRDMSPEIDMTRLNQILADAGVGIRARLEIFDGIHVEQARKKSVTVIADDLDQLFRDHDADRLRVKFGDVEGYLTDVGCNGPVAKKESKYVLLVVDGKGYGTLRETEIETWPNEET